MSVEKNDIEWVVSKNKNSCSPSGAGEECWDAITKGATDKASFLGGGLRTKGGESGASWFCGWEYKSKTWWQMSVTGIFLLFLCHFVKMPCPCTQEQSYLRTTINNVYKH